LTEISLPNVSPYLSLALLEDSRASQPMTVNWNILNQPGDIAVTCELLVHILLAVADRGIDRRSGIGDAA